MANPTDKHDRIKQAVDRVRAFEAAGSHAVAVSGYRLGTTAPAPYGP